MTTSPPPFPIGAAVLVEAETARSPHGHGAATEQIAQMKEGYKA
jgi:hypothetical protein